MAFSPGGTYSEARLRGPINFPAWEHSWKIFRNAMIMLGMASPAALDFYAQGIKLLVERWPNSWIIISTADVAVRFHEWDMLYEEMLADGFSPDESPWNFIIHETSYKKYNGRRSQWWYEQCTIKLGLPRCSGVPSPATGALVALPVGAASSSPSGDGAGGSGWGSGKGNGAPRPKPTKQPKQQPRQPQNPRQPPPPPSPSGPGGMTCWNCGGVGHAWQDCRQPLSPALSANEGGRQGHQRQGQGQRQGLRQRRGR